MDHDTMGHLFSLPHRTGKKPRNLRGLRVGEAVVLPRHLIRNVSVCTRLWKQEHCTEDQSVQLVPSLANKVGLGFGILVLVNIACFLVRITRPAIAPVAWYTENQK